MQKLVPSLLGVALIAGCSVYDLSLFRNEPAPDGTGGSSDRGDAEATIGDGAGTAGAGGGSPGLDASSSGGGAAGSAGASEAGPVVTDGPVNDGPVTDSGSLGDANGERDASAVRDASTTGDADATAAEGAVDASADVSADVQDAALPPRDVIIILDGPACGGTALSLDNTRFFTVNRPIQDDFTLEAWIKTASPSPPSLPPATDYWAGRGVFYADVGGSGNDFAATILNDRFAFGVGNPGGTDTNLISLSTVTSDQWVHVSATRQRSTGATQLFVNAVLEASAGAGNLNALTQPTTMAIGGNTNGVGNFIGLMDEVRLWNVVRTQVDIAATMHQRLLGNEPGLVGYWRFDNTGTPIDSSPTNAMAIMTGNPLYVPSDALCATP